MTLHIVHQKDNGQLIFLFTCMELTSKILRSKVLSSHKCPLTSFPPSSLQATVKGFQPIQP